MTTEASLQTDIDTGILPCNLRCRLSPIVGPPGLQFFETGKVLEEPLGFDAVQSSRLLAVVAIGYGDIGVGFMSFFPMGDMFMLVPMFGFMPCFMTCFMMAFVMIAIMACSLVVVGIVFMLPAVMSGFMLARRLERPRFKRMFDLDRFEVAAGGFGKGEQGVGLFQPG